MVRCSVPIQWLSYYTPSPQQCNVASLQCAMDTLQHSTFHSVHCARHAHLDWLTRRGKVDFVHFVQSRVDIVHCAGSTQTRHCGHCRRISRGTVDFVRCTMYNCTLCVHAQGSRGMVDFVRFVHCTLCVHAQGSQGMVDFVRCTIVHSARTHVAQGSGGMVDGYRRQR